GKTNHPGNLPKEGTLQYLKGLPAQAGSLVQGSQGLHELILTPLPLHRFPAGSGKTFPPHIQPQEESGTRLRRRKNSLIRKPVLQFLGGVLPEGFFSGEAETAFVKPEGLFRKGSEIQRKGQVVLPVDESIGDHFRIGDVKNLTLSQLPPGHQHFPPLVRQQDRKRVVWGNSVK